MDTVAHSTETARASAGVKNQGDVNANAINTTVSPSNVTPPNFASGGGGDTGQSNSSKGEEKSPKDEDTKKDKDIITSGFPLTYVTNPEYYDTVPLYFVYDEKK